MTAHRTEVPGEHTGGDTWAFRSCLRSQANLHESVLVFSWWDGHFDKCHSSYAWLLVKWEPCYWHRLQSTGGDTWQSGFPQPLDIPICPDSPVYCINSLKLCINKKLIYKMHELGFILVSLALSNDSDLLQNPKLKSIPPFGINSRLGSELRWESLGSSPDTNPTSIYHHNIVGIPNVLQNESRNSWFYLTLTHLLQDTGTSKGKATKRVKWPVFRLSKQSWYFHPPLTLWSAAQKGYPAQEAKYANLFYSHCA